jgi:DNA-binding transcriptional regulator YhcF (GntR family)
MSVAAMLGLKGSQRIVFEELQRILAEGKRPSIMNLSMRTNYHNFTVWRALSDLRESGLIEVEQEARGAPATYSIKQKDGGHR